MSRLARGLREAADRSNVSAARALLAIRESVTVLLAAVTRDRRASPHALFERSHFPAWIVLAIEREQCTRPEARAGRRASRAYVDRVRQAFNRLAYLAAEVFGTYAAFLIAFAIVLAWAISGPLFHFSDSWQLVINTGTTIVTFLMVFLIQATQNRETRALHLKMDELIRSQKRARNLFTDLEHATDEELDELEREFTKIRARAKLRRSGVFQMPERRD